MIWAEQSCSCCDHIFSGLDRWCLLCLILWGWHILVLLYVELPTVIWNYILKLFTLNIQLLLDGFWNYTVRSSNGLGRSEGCVVFHLQPVEIFFLKPKTLESNAWLFPPPGLASRVHVLLCQLESGQDKAGLHQVGRKASGQRKPLDLCVQFSSRSEHRHVPSGSAVSSLGLQPLLHLSQVRRGSTTRRALPPLRGWVTALLWENTLCLNCYCEWSCKGRQIVKQPRIPFCASVPVDKCQPAQQPDCVQSNLKIHIFLWSSPLTILKLDLSLST